MNKYFIKSAIIATVTLLAATPSFASLRFCNKTDNHVSVAYAVKNHGEWMSTGWWSIDPLSCKTVSGSQLKTRYVYYHAIDEDTNSTWEGKYHFCAEPTKNFKIYGSTDCKHRGYESLGFAEMDTEDATDFTVRLSH